VDGTQDGNEWGWFAWSETDNQGKCTGGPTDEEVHKELDPSTGTLVLPGGPETHCVVPGRYTITLREGLESASMPVPGTAHEIDFITGETTTLDGSTVVLEDSVPDIENFVDNLVHFDISSGVIHSISAVVENPGDGPVDELFRFSAPWSSTSWSREVRGRLSVRWTWDTDQFPGIKSGYMNTHVDGTIPVVRIHEYDNVGSVTAKADFLIPTGDTDEATTAFDVLPAGPAPVDSVLVSPSSATLASQGEMVELSATLRDADDNILTGRPIDWSSSNPSVDVTFRLESDPGRVAPGVVRKSIDLMGYEVEVESDGPGVTLVHLKRVREGAALPAGERLLLRIPLVSPGSERLPERLTRVELVARR